MSHLGLYPDANVAKRILKRGVGFVSYDQHGGPIALQFYFDHPNEVAGLVFIGSYSAGRQLAITEKQVLSLYDTIQGRHTVFETFITHEKFARFNPYAAEIEAMLQREACKPPIYASKATCRGFFRLDFTERLSSVQVPALVVCGDADKPVPLESSSTILAEGIPDAQLVVVRNNSLRPRNRSAGDHFIRECCSDRTGFGTTCRGRRRSRVSDAEVGWVCRSA